MKNALAASLLCVMPAGAAMAGVVDVDVSSWVAAGDYGHLDNSGVIVPVPAGSLVTAVQWIDVRYTAGFLSGINELVLSVNDSPARVGGYWNWRPDPDSNFSGTYGPGSGSFNVPSNVGPDASGPFTVTTGSLFVTAWDVFDDFAGPDERFESGTIRITYAVPGPGALVLAGAGALRLRRRRA